MAKLAGKVALVTGAGRGIGRVIALRLADDGAALAVNYSASAAAAAEVVKAIQAKGGKAVAIQADISRKAEVARMFGEIDKHLGRLDIVVNSAGVSDTSPLGNLDEQRMEKVLGVNLRGPLFVADEAAKRLGQGGRIVNFATSLIQFPYPGSSAYAGAKAAVKMFTEVWAKELGPKGVTVNTVIPGATSPGMVDANPQYKDFFANASPFKRIGTADEIAAVVAFLCSPEASWVSGAHIMANGAATT